MKRVLTSLVVLIAVSVAIVSCSGYKSSSSSSTSTHRASGLKFRAFVSNPLFPNSGISTPVVNIVDASKDVLSTSVVSVVANSAQPGLMALSPDLKFTAVFSPAGNSITIIDNTTESVAGVAGTTGTLPSITLPGATESMLISNDHNTLYAAVPTAPVNGPPGGVEVVSLQTGNVTALIPVAGAHFLVPSPNGNSILVFSDNSDVVTVIATVLIGTHTDPRNFVTGFDRPVWGIFNGSSSAFILNCGPQCGGKAAGISILDIGSSTGMGTVPVAAATYGVLNGSTLYVAGTSPPSPPGTNTCVGSTTAAKTCGRLTILDAGTLTVTGTAIIADGRHSGMQISQNGQLFIGAHSCTNINVQGGEVRGCLSIVNPAAGTVTIAPQNGDVTGMQSIAGRNIMYVVQNGVLGIYDTTTDKLQVSPPNNLNTDGQVVIVGQPFDVKLVD